VSRHPPPPAGAALHSEALGNASQRKPNGARSSFRRWHFHRDKHHPHPSPRARAAAAGFKARIVVKVNAVDGTTTMIEAALFQTRARTAPEMKLNVRGACSPAAGNRGITKKHKIRVSSGGGGLSREFAHIFSAAGGADEATGRGAVTGRRGGLMCAKLARHRELAWPIRGAGCGQPR